MRRLVTLGLAMLLGIFGIAGSAGAQPPMLPGMDEMMAQNERDVTELMSLTGRDFEIAYMQKIRTHHMAALDMARMVPGKAVHPELTRLAQTIIADQQREIGQLEGWLRDWYGITTPAMMPMDGMDAMMAAMMRMTGAEFEQAFLLMMVHHHQGAIDMSAQAPGRATHPELLTFARNVITEQQREQQQMQDWAMTWYGFDPLPVSHGGTPTPGLPNTGAGGTVRGPAGAIWSVQGLIVAAGLAALLLAAQGLRRRAAGR